MEFVSQVEREGYAICYDAIHPDVVADVGLACERASREPDRRRGEIRNLLESAPLLRHLVVSTEVRTLIEPILGDKALMVRAILFDKTANSNWKVPWHHDVTIAVRERVDTAGFGP